MATYAPQPMGDFVYYNPENTSKNSKQHGTFTTYPLGLNDTVPIYSQPMAYLRPTSSGSQTSYAPSGYMMQPMMTPLASPQPLYHHKQMLPFVEQHEPYLHPIDTDLHIVPSTPPLSVSGSNINSPPSCTDSLCTPVNEAFFGALKHGCEQDVFLEPIGHEFVGGASPPMTPVFISSASQGSLMAPASCPSLSPSPSPAPRAADSSDTEANFCDPRNLTVTPTNVALPDITLPSIPVEDEDSKLSSFAHGLVDVSASPSFASLTFPPLADLDVDDDFSSLTHISTSDNINFLGAKRQRTDLCSPLSQDDDLLFADSPISEFDSLDFACHGLPTPCDTDSSFCMSAPEKPKKKMKFVKKANRLSDGDSDSDFVMNTASTGSQQKTQSGEYSNEQQGHDESHNHGHSSGSEDQSNPTPAPVSRRGRKQSLTEDPSKTFVCDLCSRRFRRQEHLKRHYRSLHTHDKPFACTDCGKKFSRSDNLSQHQRTHGTGAMVLGVLENPAHYSGDEAYNSNDTDGLGEILYNAAAAVSTDSSISGYSDNEMSPSGDKKMKKRKREE